MNFCLLEDLHKAAENLILPSSLIDVRLARGLPPRCWKTTQTSMPWCDLAAQFFYDQGRLYLCIQQLYDLEFQHGKRRCTTLDLMHSVATVEQNFTYASELFTVDYLLEYVS